MNHENDVINIRKYISESFIKQVNYLFNNSDDDKQLQAKLEERNKKKNTTSK